MTSTKMRTTLGVVLAGVAAVLGLLAGPAGAQTIGPGNSIGGGAGAGISSVASGPCVAIDDSTCSGSGHAVDDSTSSGRSDAFNGSNASGCSLARNDATASGGSTAMNDATTSGGPCPPATTATTAPVTTTPPTARLALTGSPSAELAALAVLVLALGGVLVLVGSRRPVEG